MRLLFELPLLTEPYFITISLLNIAALETKFFQLTALLVKMSLENASCGSEHKCFGALDAPFIGYQHNAVLITCLYVSDYKIVGRALKWAQCNARGGAHDPGERYTYIIL